MRSPRNGAEQRRTAEVRERDPGAEAASLSYLKEPLLALASCNTAVVPETITASCFSIVLSPDSFECFLYVPRIICDFSFSVILAFHLDNRMRISFVHWSTCCLLAVTSGAALNLERALLVFSTNPVPGKFVSWLLPVDTVFISESETLQGGFRQFLT